MRDWSVGRKNSCVFPYGESGLESLPHDVERLLWPYKTTLWNRRTFSKSTYQQEGQAWWSWHQVALDRLKEVVGIPWAFVATHNHFVLSTDQTVFKQSAPIIKLPPGSPPSAYLELLQILNSSSACFWLKQVCQDKGVGGIGGGIGDEAWEPRYEFNAGNVSGVPIPRRRSATIAGHLEEHARARELLLRDVVMTEGTLEDFLIAVRERDDAITRCMISLQEELDWQILAAFGLVEDDLPVLGEHAPPVVLGQRAFEIALARQVAVGEMETTWFERHDSTPVTEVPHDWPVEYREVVERRIALIESDPDIGLIERPEHKRRWNRASWGDRQRGVLATMVLDALEDRDLWSDLRPRSTAELTDLLRTQPVMVEALELLAEKKDTDLAATVRRLVADAAVPHLAAQRLTEKGLAKHAVWERVWDLQRAQDRGEDFGLIPVPPKYAQVDFRSGAYWRHRSKLDVPKERFVLIPNAERGADSSPVVGWAGWDERDLARALAARVMELREQDAADAERVSSLLAGVLELLPWIHQWHPESDPLYGGPPGQYFEGWLDGQLAELAITRETLRSWRPSAPTRGRKARVTNA